MLRHPLARRILRVSIKVALCLGLFASLWVAAYRFINPPITNLMVMEYFRVGSLKADWRPLEEISPHLAKAVVASEDQLFCQHSGFHLREIRAALLDETRRRGGSTITQQTAKNAFLWPDASWLRKGVEAGFTILVELFWPKERILEVYLNIAEFGSGVFGAEAAAQHIYGRSAAKLNRDQSIRLAAVLPSPRRRSPRSVSAKRVATISNDMRYLADTDHYDCLPKRE
ncbi:MAG: monofunctional biosynthetic peptidoglycan transglycosylase [Pseudomonadota bacterium]